MENNFFDLVNDRFFAPFTGSNKEINYLLLKMINSNMKNEMEFVERGEILSWIRDFYEERPNADKFDDEESKEIDDIKILASYKLSYFEKSGWLISENTSNFKTVYQMDSAAIGIIDAMNGIVDKETKPVEYTGYVYNIYTLLKNFETSHATQIVEQIREASNRLNDSLRSLNNSIKKYLQALLKGGKDSPKNILNSLLNDYQKNVISKAFNNLRMNDNPSKYRNEIINKIHDLLEKHIEEMINNYIEVKHSGQKNDAIAFEARNFFIEALAVIEDQIENIDGNISVLDQRNTKYVSSTKARVTFLINNEINIEGKIYEILKLIEQRNLSENTEFYFGLSELGKIDDTSLYTYTNRKKRVTSKAGMNEKPVLSIEEEEKIKRDFLRQSKFSITEVNMFILSKLGKAKIIQASDINISSYDDLIKLFLAQIYSGSDFADYTINVTDGYYAYENAKLTNFSIKRR